VIWRVAAILGALVGAVIVAALIVFFFVAKAYRIPSSAMEPTLHCARPASGCEGKHQDRVIVFKFLGYGRGDIVVFRVPRAAQQACGAGGVFVKRIVGMPGDNWQETQGFVYVNGKKLIESYVDPGKRDVQSYPSRRIRADNYFMMGDNRSSSCDSRVWGTVSKDRIIGRVFARYWPLPRIHIY
jgi:signal peptidase I